MRPRIAIFLVALLAVAACKKADAPHAAPAAAIVSATPTSLESARSLALAAPVDSAPVDALIRRLEASAVKNPRKGDLWILLGRAWIRKARETSDPGYYAHADGCADLALDAEPGSRLALDLRAMVLLNDHQFEGARAVAARIVAENADDPSAYGTLSDALLELGQFDAAAEAAEKMMDLKPNLPSYSRASYLRWLQGDTKMAKQIARHAIDAGGDTRDPEPLAWVLVQAGMIFWHEGDYAGAEAGFDRALVAFPEFAPALAGKARVAMARADAATAASLLERSYKASPLVETAWLLGDARAAAGDAVASEEAYARVVTLGHRTDGRTLALFFATKSRDTAEALRLAAEERKVRGDIYTDDVYAWAAYRSGKLVDARAASDHALRLGTHDARLLYHGGAIRIAMGEVAAGRAMVARALATNPRFDATGASEAAEMLAVTQ